MSDYPYGRGSDDQSLPMNKATKSDGLTEVQLRNELERAYRCIMGFSTARKKGQVLDDTAFAYHSPTIGAARRFVKEGALDGSDYFTGKKIDVLHAALDL